MFFSKFQKRASLYLINSLIICLASIVHPYHMAGQTVLIDSIPLAIRGDANYIFGESGCSLSTGTQSLAVSLGIDPACYSSMTVHIYAASDGNLDYSGSGSDYLDISVDDGITSTKIANQNPNICGPGSINTAVTLSGESGCDCDWGQLTLHCSGTWRDCPGSAQPGPQEVTQVITPVSSFSIDFDYRVSNSAKGTCEDACDEMIQVQYVLITGVQQSCASLPIELIAFDVASEGCSNQLSWRVGEAIDFSHFEVERSLNGVDFEQFEIVEWKNYYQYYQIVDQEGGRNVYYRLKLVDLDGTYEYSVVLSHTNSQCFGEEQEQFIIYPNPVLEKKNINLKLKVRTTSIIDMCIVGKLGQIIRQTPIQCEEGWNHVNLNIEDLPQGIYEIHMLSSQFKQSKSFCIVK